MNEKTVEVVEEFRLWSAYDVHHVVINCWGVTLHYLGVGFWISKLVYFRFSLLSIQTTLVLSNVGLDV